jgi:membrane-associated phospholipid phosphatase
VLGALVAVFALLVALVELGAFSSIDQFAIDHLMPPLTPGGQSTVSLSGLYNPFGRHTSWWVKVYELWTYPCSVLVSLLVVTTVVAVAFRRGRLATALVFAGAWVAGNAIELIGKELIRRPALHAAAHGVHFHVSAFDNSFPSGHMIRGMMVAATLLVVWPRAKVPLIAWCALVGPLLVLSAAHTPSDIAGGLVVGSVLIVAARACARVIERAVPPRFAALAGARRTGATAP